MNLTRMIGISGGAAAVALAALVAPAAAQAGGHLSWSVGISAGLPVYSAPAPIYVQPRPVYVQPQPVYVRPQPVYVQPRPIYVQPRPIYVAPPGYYGGAVVAAPAPVYPIGWAPRGHWRHRHQWRGPGFGY